MIKKAKRIIVSSVVVVSLLLGNMLYTEPETIAAESHINVQEIDEPINPYLGSTRDSIKESDLFTGYSRYLWGLSQSILPQEETFADRYRTLCCDEISNVSENRLNVAAVLSLVHDMSSVLASKVLKNDEYANETKEKCIMDATRGLLDKIYGDNFDETSKQIKIANKKYKKINKWLDAFLKVKIYDDEHTINEGVITDCLNQISNIIGMPQSKTRTIMETFEARIKIAHKVWKGFGTTLKYMNMISQIALYENLSYDMVDSIMDEIKDVDDGSGEHNILYNALLKIRNKMDNVWEQNLLDEILKEGENKIYDEIEDLAQKTIDKIVPFKLGSCVKVLNKAIYLIGHDFLGYADTSDILTAVYTEEFSKIIESALRDKSFNIYMGNCPSGHDIVAYGNLLNVYKCSIILELEKTKRIVPDARKSAFDLGV